jgi:hypothetical protein
MLTIAKAQMLNKPYIHYEMLNNEQRQQVSHWTDIIIRQVVNPRFLTIDL